MFEDITAAFMELPRGCSPKAVRKGTVERPISLSRDTDKAVASVLEKQQHFQVG